jgi:hypothetical protein
LALIPLALVACAPPAAEPAPAEQRSTPPPWDAPRDAISQIEFAGLEVLRSGYRPAARLVARLEVVVDGRPVQVPAFIGIDRVRAVEAPLHTHTPGGQVWVEHPGQPPTTTLGQFFDLWGVRFDSGCVGDACANLQVLVDGRELPGSADPRDVEWRSGRTLRVSADR